MYILIWLMLIEVVHNLQVYGSDRGRERAPQGLLQGGEEAGEDGVRRQSQQVGSIDFKSNSYPTDNSICTSRDQSDSEDEQEPNENDAFPSLDSVPSDNSLSGTFSPRFSSEPPSLTESMQMLEEILQNKSMDRIARIDKLEAILTTATSLPCEQVSNELE